MDDEKRREVSRLGGIASGEARRAAKKYREDAEYQELQGETR